MNARPENTQGRDDSTTNFVGMLPPGHGPRSLDKDTLLCYIRFRCAFVKSMKKKNLADKKDTQQLVLPPFPPPEHILFFSWIKTEGGHPVMTELYPSPALSMTTSDFRKDPRANKQLNHRGKPPGRCTAGGIKESQGWGLFLSSDQARKCKNILSSPTAVGFMICDFRMW